MRRAASVPSLLRPWVVLAFVALSIGWGGALSAVGATFTSTLDRNSMVMGESVTLSLSFEGGAPGQMPNLPLPPGLALQGVSTSRRMVMENFTRHDTFSFDCQIAASRPGDYVIPSIEAQVDGQTLRSQPITLKVTKASGRTGLAFVRMAPSKETVYLGEPFVVDVQLYLAARQDSLQMPQMEGDGFLFGKPPQPTQSNVQLGNQLYNVILFKMSATAVKTGALTLGPVQCSMVLHIPATARGRSLLDDFFGGVQRKPVTLASDPQTITVLPLPKENRPATFNGAVGTFTLATAASPTNLMAGDPITLHVEIAGQGNLESLGFPAGTDWPDFKLYPATSKIETLDPLGISGTKRFERVVIPQSAAVRQIPPIHFSYFDPEQKAYRTVSGEPVAIAVTASSGTGPQPVVLAGSRGTEDQSAAIRDIVHIKPYLGTVTNVAAPLLLRPWYLGLQALPVVMWLSAWLWRRRQDQLANNPRLRRRLATSETIRQGLKNLSSLAQTSESNAFFAAVFRLLQEQLGERLDLPASAITEAVIDERLSGRAPDDLVAELHRLFQLCNQVRYASQPSRQELSNLVPQVEDALRQLGQLPEQTRTAALK